MWQSQTTQPTARRRATPTASRSRLSWTSSRAASLELEQSAGNTSDHANFEFDQAVGASEVLARALQHPSVFASGELRGKRCSNSAAVAAWRA